MLEMQTKLEYSVASAKESKTAAIIVAAGNASRMGGADKQMMAIKGIPVLARTLLRFQNTSEIDEIIVVTKAEKTEAVAALAKEYDISKLCCVVCGGATRQESVKNGIDALNSSVKTVLIHDGARPLIKETIISRVAKEAQEFGAAACGARIYDTVKQIDADGNIIGTLDRDYLIRIQTPQGFDLEKYKEAMESCPDISLCTDDCAVMESASYKIRLVESDDTNIKVTTPGDVAAAERILALEEEI